MKWFVLALILVPPFTAVAALSDAQRSSLDRITGGKGVYSTGENVHKISFPRTDVKVTVDRRELHPFLGLTSWASFTQGGFREGMVMGDLVLFEDEVNPVLSTALDNGLEVTALHNHFFYDSPKVMFLHIGGEGQLADLANGVKRCLEKVKEIRTANPQPVSTFGGSDLPPSNSIRPEPLDRILGVKGQSNQGMYKATIGRMAHMHSKDIGNQMGVNTWAAFSGSDENALVDGDFAMTTNELQPVLKELRKAGIQIVAIHNHMTMEQPQYVFLHYWGKGRADRLAQGLHLALDRQAQRGGREMSHPGH